MANISLPLVLLLTCLIKCLLVSQCEAARAFFVFGDSLVDNGNNDYLFTSARADAYPYGIDTPSHQPTGRFSNGKNIPDIISEHLGAEPTLPYLSPHLQGQKLLVGANFASAGIGILNDTGIQFMNIIRIAKQLEYFQQYQQRLGRLVGDAEAQRLRLHELGARRVLVTGTGPLGCVPAELAQRSRNGNCDVELQRAAALFNPQLVEIINQLNQEIGSNVFVFANAFDMHMDYISNPTAYGLISRKGFDVMGGGHSWE
ncbi:GDSL esterase/lipase [Acorus calamus]|uniref:GDSL esterase/lipase n=1 Tax=Acorus calamus TaxID=4465 RepID=A0AAV9CQX4_ACOCL|nr:GDSL esterase/lipase [Acorus calamus]